MYSSKNIARLHYLTQDDVPGFSHAELAAAACEAGVKWVQFRSKKITGRALLSEAQKVKEITDSYGAVLIINDHADVAAELGAGAHVGKTDIPVREARKILGPHAIIGGTANTENDIIRLTEEGADYIGLGPYRFTVTKENLSPVIESGEWQRLLTIQGRVPVIVIGGITPGDVRQILNLGAYGVAVSSAINMHSEKAEQARLFIKTFELQEA